MLTRRQTLMSAAALPLATALPAIAEAPMLGASRAMHRRIALGAFEVTMVSAGVVQNDSPRDLFGTNISDDEFIAASEAAFISPDEGAFFFTPTVVNTGAELVLFDTGLSADGIVAALGQAGYTPDQIDVVVLTHMHGDHIGGLMTDSGPTFPNARYLSSRAEFDFWAGAENQAFDGLVRPLAERFQFLEDGQDVTGGLTAIAAYGHTPGHTVFRIESEGQAMILFADLANHPVWSLANPDWHFSFDIDKDMAAESRRRVLSMIAADRLPAIGYHMPFPSFGFVDTRGDGFHWVPESGQLG